MSRINRLERESVKFIAAGRYCGITIRSRRTPAGEGVQRAAGGCGGGENWVTTVDAVVNKEMAGEQRCRLCFIRSFKGVMWHYVGNWLSLKEPTSETEGGGRKEGGDRGCSCVCAEFPTRRQTHFLDLHAVYTNTFLAPVKHFISPLGKPVIKRAPPPHHHHHRATPAEVCCCC